MESLVSNIQIQVQDSLYVKDPQSSDLGKKIIKGSIELICELGFEQFTFKKLAVKISSTEASVYGFMKRKAIFREGLGSVLVVDDYDDNKEYLKPKRER